MKENDTDRLFQRYLEDTTGRVRYSLELQAELEEGVSLRRLREINDHWYRPLEKEGYGEDWANPDVSAEAFGTARGRFLAAFRHDVLNTLLPCSFRRDSCPGERALAALGKLEDAGLPGVETVLRAHFRRPDPKNLKDTLRRRYDPEEKHIETVMMGAAPEDLSCLYRYGKRVSPVQTEMAGFLFSLPESDLRGIAATLARAYLQGVTDEGKDRFRERKTVAVNLPMGGEALFPFIRESFADAGFHAHASGVHRPPVNRQAAYDHRFRYALYLDGEMVENHISMLKEILTEIGPVLRAFSGIAHLDLFGEKPFSPEPKASMPLPDREISALYKSLTQQSVMLQLRHVPRGETSFSMIAFPSPEIGDSFREIFRDCVRVNTLSNDVYRPLQAALIDSMDGGEKVRILGAPGNDTDLTVFLRPLDDPETETAFENCLASVNIPVGEVFTTPVLKGTGGVLHVREAFLAGLRYENLKLVFSEGEAVDWSCTNFEDPEKNREYIRENLFHPHDTLPMGEFAIGTNTEAYAMGVKHRIMDVLPVLILEKMGPHFALGDTCYSREEDIQRFDPVSGKRLVAVENQRSALRRQDPDKAYTNRHVDITLPYTDLDSISAFHPDGREVFLMKGGRFVLPGTEVLNEPLSRLDR